MRHRGFSLRDVPHFSCCVGHAGKHVSSGPLFFSWKAGSHLFLNSIYWMTKRGLSCHCTEYMKELWNHNYTVMTIHPFLSFRINCKTQASCNSTLFQWYLQISVLILNCAMPWCSLVCLEHLFLFSQQQQHTDYGSDSCLLRIAISIWF